MIHPALRSGYLMRLVVGLCVPIGDVFCDFFSDS
jgi:hypothetical protein